MWTYIINDSELIAGNNMSAPAYYVLNIKEVHSYVKYE